MFCNNQTCQNCENRHVGCHNVNTCAYWKEHEAAKEEMYDKRLTAANMRNVERTFYIGRKRQIAHNTRRP